MYYRYLFLSHTYPSHTAGALQLCWPLTSVLQKPDLFEAKRSTLDGWFKVGKLLPHKRASVNTYLISFHKCTRYLNFQWAFQCSPHGTSTFGLHPKARKQNTSRRSCPSQWAQGAVATSILKQNTRDQHYTGNCIIRLLLQVHISAFVDNPALCWL